MTQGRIAFAFNRLWVVIHKYRTPEGHKCKLFAFPSGPVISGDVAHLDDVCGWCTNRRSQRVHGQCLFSSTKFKHYIVPVDYDRVSNTAWVTQALTGRLLF